MIDYHLTPRQKEIAQLLAAGYTNIEIARALVLSERTVQTHVCNILRGTGMRSRVEIVAWAVVRGNVDGEEAVSVIEKRAEWTYGAY